MGLLHNETEPNSGYMEWLAAEDGLKSRMRENRTYGSVRGSRQSLHVQNTVKGVSRLSTRQC
jgi:hypothetical protein